MEEYLSCQLCKDFFKDPIILPCTHCFCRGCLLKHSELCESPAKHFDNKTWFTHNRDSINKFQCPECSTSVDNNLDILPKFDLIQPILDRIIESKNNVGSVNCDFCEDYSKQPATLKCVQCNYNYCGNCFDTFHISRGPLAKHEIIDPLQDQEYPITHVCPRHDNEKKKLFCKTCGVSICFLCKEIGEHLGHTTQIVDSYQERVRSKISHQLNELIHWNETVESCLNDSDNFSLFIKKTGLETEGHVIRECDNLIAIIEQQKDRLLEMISSKFNESINEVSECNQNLSTVQGKLNSVVELLNHSLESTDDNAVLEAASLLKNRSLAVGRTVEESVRKLQEYFSVNPFNGMVLDFFQYKKDLQNINWLKAPLSPKFKIEKCFVRNNTAYLSWEAVKGRITNYYLEKSFVDDDFQLVYEGKDCRNIPVHMHYNALSIFRACASNSAGKGSYSDEILLESPSGINLYIDRNRTSDSVEILEEESKVICNALKYGEQYVVADVQLNNGTHFWKIRVNEIIEGKTSKGRMVFGIANDLDESYGLVINIGVTEKEINDEHAIYIHRKPTEICQQDLTFLLNFQQQIFDIYLNGKIVLKDASQLHTFQRFGNATYRPFIGVEGCNVNMSIIDDLSEPLSPPEKPRFKKAKCYSDNIDLVFHWHNDSAKTDAFLLNVSTHPTEEDSKIVYRGNKCSFAYEAERYDQTIYVRLCAVNILGESEVSDLLTLTTATGLGFSLQEDRNSSLQLWSKNRSVKYSSEFPLMLFGDVVFERGIHFWRMTVEQFEGKNAVLSVGLSLNKTRHSDFGLKDSFAVTICTKTSAEQDNPINAIVIPIKNKALLNSDFGFLVDVNMQKFYCYLNGMLIVRNKSTSSHSKHWSTFSNIHPGLLPAFCVLGNLKFSLLCDQPLPNMPAPPLFQECNCETITCHFSWKPSRMEGSYTNVFVLKVAVSDLSKPKTEEIFKEVYKGNALTYELKQVSYNSKVTATVTAVNIFGKSKESEKLVLFTAKGFLFDFSDEMKSGEIKLSNQKKTASLNSLVHSYVLGNRVIEKGLHSWQIRIDGVEEQNKMSVIGIGISKAKLNDPILGEDQFSYAVQIIQHPKVNIRHTGHRHQIQMTSEEACHANFLLEVNLDENWMNVFLNGSQLRNDSSLLGKPTFSDVRGNYYPAISMYGSKVQVSIGSSHHL